MFDDSPNPAPERILCVMPTIHGKYLTSGEALQVVCANRSAIMSALKDFVEVTSVRVAKIAVDYRGIDVECAHSSFSDAGDCPGEALRQAVREAALAKIPRRP